MAASSAGSWLASPFQAAPDCGFFPRSGFCVAPFPPGAAAYVFGGQSGGRLLNDIWALRSSADGVQWEEVSPNVDPKGSVAAGQTVVSSKWSGRERFAAAVAGIARGRLAMYVCGGLGKMNKMADFWASEDSGKNWYCMTQQMPCGGRTDPGLLAVPGHYEQLVLCCGVSAGEGGMQMHADIWVSGDAGSTWAELARPPAQMEPRAAPLVTFLAGTSAGGGCRLLILGGTCVGDEQEALLADAWEATLDVNAKAVEWHQLGEPPEAPAGFNGHTAAFDHSALASRAVDVGGEDTADGGALSPGAIVAVHDLELKLSPPLAPHAWAACGLRGEEGGALQIPSTLKSVALRLCFLPAVASEPQLLAFSERGAAAAAVGRAQLWEVVGGGDKGGIVVREGQDLASPELERLSTGAMVAELALAGNRLHFQLRSGTGPSEGWVNVALKDKELVRRL